MAVSVWLNLTAIDLGQKESDHRYTMSLGRQPEVPMKTITNPAFCLAAAFLCTIPVSLRAQAPVIRDSAGVKIMLVASRSKAPVTFVFLIEAATLPNARRDWQASD